MEQRRCRVPGGSGRCVRPGALLAERDRHFGCPTGMQGVLSLKAGKIILLGATCGLLAAAVNVSSMIAARQGELGVASHCAACAAASGVELEFARLEQRIAAALTPASAVGVEDVRLRFDRLGERVMALDAPDVRALLDRAPEAAATADRLAALMDRLAPMLDRIGRPEVGAAALQLMAPLDFELSRLSATADRLGEARAAAGQAELARLYTVFTAVLSSLFAFGAALSALLFWHNRKLGEVRDRLAASTAGLEAASLTLASANAETTAAAVELQARNAVLDRRDRELGLQNKRFDAALNNMSMALCMVDADDRLVVYNQRFADLFGLDFAPIPGLSFADLVAMAAGPWLAQVHARQRTLSTEGDAVESFVQDLPPGPGAAPDARRTLSVLHRPMRDGGWVATYDDITQRRQAEARIAFLARHDPLTGLLNRTALVEYLDAAMADAERRGSGVAVHYIDLDGFKEVNDGFGHGTGDELLREVGRRLVAQAGSGAVARLGGDEFAVVQAGADPAAAEALALRLKAALGEPSGIAGVDRRTTACAGHAVAPSGADGADGLLKNALLALAAAKLAGPGAVRAFVPDMDAARRARRALEADLRQALGAGQFDVFFQPLVDVRRLAITGFEALLRWRHPARGLVSPAEFIPVAEEIGLIGEIGAWVLAEACRRAAGWPGEQTVAVNLSPAQFGVTDLAAAVDAALAASGLHPHRLELEITESVPLGDDSLAALHALKERGIRIAMDDFGTGYSSLSYLRRFPFDKIKIDQSFVRELASRPDCIKIVRSITALGASLGMTTTAEGVETAEQFAQLQAAGCDQVQGYHFGRPRPGAELVFDLGPDLRPAAAA